jgi:Arc/MetJ family transcription regulator
MPTNLALDDDLLAEALELGGHRTKRETVNEALSEYIARRKRLAAIDAFGTFDFDPEFDYKRERRKR